MRIISSIDVERWHAVLERCTTYDFYHLATYHHLQARESNSRAVLFVYEEEELLVALPLLVRSLKEIEGLGEVLLDQYDATSVYGYAGPITNHDWSDGAFFKRFGHALKNALLDMQVIAAFSRLHPVFENDRGLFLGEIVPLGQTVSVDLTIPLEEQFYAYRKSHRYEIRKARKEGVEAFLDSDWRYYDDFVELYLSTMNRVEADEYYLFDRSYFDDLRAALGPNLNLFVAQKDGVIISGALFTLIGNIVEYHLSGSSTSWMQYAASKLVIDTARLWAVKQGAEILHLGGGFGSQEDTLFLFKSGFSNRFHRFKIWEYVVDPERYAQAVDNRKKWLHSKNLQLVQASFFPAYRTEYIETETT